MRLKLLAVMLGMGALLAAGCGSDPTAPTTTTIIVPKTGSTFTFLRRAVDSNGVIRPGSEDTVTISVLNGDTTVEGKSGVMVTSGGEPVPYKYESNGDVSILSSFSKLSFKSPVKWSTLPFGSREKGEKVVFEFDTSATVQGQTESFSVRQTVEYIGDEEITIGTKKVNASKVIVRMHSETGRDTTTETIDLVEGLWFSPAVGFLVKMDGAYRSDRIPMFDAWVVTMMEYSLK